ncbi:MAG: hypothetical protein R3B09_18975 [Nannocystaceae bacterium]
MRSVALSSRLLRLRRPARGLCFTSWALVAACAGDDGETSAASATTGESEGSTTGETTGIFTTSTASTSAGTTTTSTSADTTVGTTTEGTTEGTTTEGTTTEGTTTEGTTEGTTDTEGTTTGEPIEPDFELLKVDLEDPYLKIYEADGDGGVGHVTYFSLDPKGAEFMALAPEEQAKVTKIQASPLHSYLWKPKDEIAGVEVTGTLQIDDGGEIRRQEVVLKVPLEWNGGIAVAGAPGTRSEFSNEAVLVPWLLARGYAYVSGNKGMTNAGADGNTTMLNQKHPTAAWGSMMIDLALWSRARLAAAMMVPVERTYAVGLSNGGYQVRRALEIDHERVQGGEDRLFDGGLDWAGGYWPDARALDADKDQKVSVQEFAAFNHLVATNERAAQAIGWAYAPGTLNTPAEFATNPPYKGAQAAMQAAGFSAPSAPIWGAYNSTFDYLKGFGLTQYKGVGYYNITAYVFRAELLGDDAAASTAYTCYSDGGDQPPAFYPYLESAIDGGWTAESVTWALKNGNSGEFSAPLITVHGERDGLLGLEANAQAYRDAVVAHGDPKLHRLYVIANGGHVDQHSDGGLDFDFDGMFGNEMAADVFTPVQPFAERAFDYLVAWAEDGVSAPAGKTVATDPKNDVTDVASISFE